MKRYNITVNGTTYDVAVQEADADNEFAIPTAPAQTAKPAAAPKVAAKPAASGAQGGVKINAPMPGTILDVKAKAGAEVKKGTVIAILEAMKMENDIVAPQDGVLVSVNVTKGESVNTGTVIATMN